MTKMVVIAVLVSIGVTLLLTAVLWRINAPKRAQGGGDGGAYVPATHSARRDHDDSSDAGDSGDGGGGD
ncbi:MAG TPA: hypothetical protein PLN53_11460 [Terricaulis sp.]|nr:hypothetical protein [Terricaulis sp.]